MIRNYFKIAWRNLFRNKVYSFINVGGLAMGIAAFLLILEYVSFEKSVNQFHANLPQIYRLLNFGQKGETWTEIEPGWAAKAKQTFPEIKDFCRFAEGTAKGIVKREGANSESFRETEIGYADGNFFDFFSFPIINGDKSALKKPKVVFISKKTAVKYFSEQDPLGKTLTLSNQFGTLSYSVEGVYDIPANSDIQFDMLFSLETLANPANLNGNSWARLDNTESQYINTYFLLNDQVNPANLQSKLTAMRTSLKADKDGVQFRLQPLKNIHLADKLSDTYQTSGNLKYVYMLLIIAVLILCIAWFNYINLSTAHALKRANEVGVRKVIGATPWNLISQFLGESALVNMLSLSLAVVLVYLLQPLFNQLIGRELTLEALGNSPVWIAGLGVLFLGSLLSGIYTAYALSNFNPVKILKGNLSKTSKGILLRKSLVVSQFTISIVLILVTIVIYTQLRFMQSQNLGMKTDQLLVVRGPEVGKDSTYKNRQAAFWNELEQQSFVKDYSLSGTVPGSFFNFATSGFTQPGSKAGDELKPYFFAIIGDRYLNTYGIELKAGRNFTEQEVKVDWDENSKILLNEKAVEQFGFRSAEEAINNKVKWDERFLEVIGVVKDYHHLGLQKAINPIIFYPQNSTSYITIKLTPDQIQNKMAKLEGMYKTFFAGNPFEYFFVDENFNKQYFSENQYGKIFTTASVWAIFIACMGLFGLATFTVETRTKEIGIRKVLGASVASIVGLLSFDFLKLVVAAILIASPLAWYFMTDWLKDFEYQIKVSWWIFAAGGATAVIIAILTIGFQSIKAALMNPVKSLKSE
ncbi:ABC transporter permease [Dyadobacter psychrotolerans]|uniref:FtsX-like permease family protein n=1 Tax=Dyadobacter psychrotolerans TaxID=2541721 RepID=A0A4R5E0J8_9BACT|nr:ABC transporter permease [Dyadobacter psychrotolerans]TDE18544.1 FtsX-like permease family protein [Dyadobacter psychrotolerans]